MNKGKTKDRKTSWTWKHHDMPKKFPIHNLKGIAKAPLVTHESVGFQVTGLCLMLQRSS